MSTNKRFRRGAVALGTSLVVGAGLLAGFGPTASLASSHREAPLISNDPQADNTDVYAFVSPDSPRTVTLISNFIPFEEPAGGPNFYRFATGAHYNVKIDNNGDAVADEVFQWRFQNHYRSKDTFLYNTGPVTSLNDPNLNFYQTYTLIEKRNGKTRVLVKDARVAPSRVGGASMPNYRKLRRQAVEGFAHGKAESFAGQAEDPFFLDLRVFDLLYGANLKEVGNDTLAGFNVNTIALQVPKAMLARGGDAKKHPIIGIWSTVDRKRVAIKAGSAVKTTKYSEVSRLGAPLVNEVVIPLKDKDLWNRSRPKGDQQFGSYVTDPELPKLIQAVYGIPAPKPPRNDLVKVFLTGIQGLNKPKGVEPSEELRLNMGIPPCRPKTCSKYSPLGVIGGDLAGYPNGRRLADDVIDIALRAVEGILRPHHPAIVNKLGDGVRHNDRAFGSAFPYEGLPFSGSHS